MSRFDRFAAWAARGAAQPAFFTFCVVLVVVWFPTLFLIDLNTSQLIVNTATTIITFLMVALLHNDQQRFEKATNLRLQAIVDAIEGISDPVRDESQREH